MSRTLGEAVAEAGAFIASVSELDGRDAVDVAMVGAWGHPPLTMGALRALYELAAEICAVAGQYDPELIDRRIARKLQLFLTSNVRPRR